MVPMSPHHSTLQVTCQIPVDDNILLRLIREPNMSNFLAVLVACLFFRLF